MEGLGLGFTVDRECEHISLYLIFVADDLYHTRLCIQILIIRVFNFHGSLNNENFPIYSIKCYNIPCA